MQPGRSGDKQKRIVGSSPDRPVIQPRLSVVHAPEGYAAHFVAVFDEYPEHVRITAREFLLHGIRQAFGIGIHLPLLFKFLRDIRADHIFGKGKHIDIHFGEHDLQPELSKLLDGNVDIVQLGEMHMIMSLYAHGVNFNAPRQQGAQ